MPHSPLAARRQIAGPLAVGGGGAAVSNGLLNALIAFWPCNEASGNALDLHANALHLTQYNGVGNAAGLIYPLARAYSSPSLQYHARPGDDELLSITGDVTIAVWVYISPGQSTGPVLSKERVVGTSREYALFYISSGYFQVIMYYNNTTSAVAVSNTSSPVVPGWALVVIDFDTVNSLLHIQTNNGATDSIFVPGVPTNGNSAFALSRRFTSYSTVVIGPTMVWKSAPGGGGVLTAEQRTALYNGGVGLTYAEFTS